MTMSGMVRIKEEPSEFSADRVIAQAVPQKSIFLIEHGQKTCASAPGKFCQFVYARNYGTTPYCGLFSETLYEHRDGEFKGWLARCDQCYELKQEQT